MPAKPADSGQPSMQAQAQPARESGLDEAMAGLDELEELPTAEHVARFTAVHDALVAALASADEV